MTAQLIDGNALSRQLRADVAARVQALKARGVTPGLAVILVGDNQASQVYVRNKVKACEDTGMHSVLETWPASMSEPELLARVDAQQDDIILLDWQVGGSQTPTLVRDILNRNPLLRVVALLPEHQRQYRQLVWDAGACNGIPKEHIDQEWLSTVLCLMYRAMQREAKFLEKA